ncbi:MAG: NAD(P)H-hydrate dehydratase [Ruminococcaceae bacterium]|nr:NAD(P)H-hydrate dehydratase [Oscillospiraceae bacterium]
MTDTHVFSYTENDIAKLNKRPERSNKGTFGRVLSLCGSMGMAGAAYLSALGAYRAGAGLVEIFTPEENRIILQTLIPEAVITTYDSEKPDTELLLSSLSRASSVTVGCGLGKSQAALELLKTVLRNSEIPTVIDADGLNMISEHPFLLKYAKGMILTPHPVEMSRLTGLPVEYILDNTEEVAYNFAREHSLVCLLKDSRTVVSDGVSIYINTSGCSAMAKGGSGDVLTGIIGALLAEKHLELSSLEAASMGAYIHGLAGERARDLLGEYSLLARDIANNIRI